MLSPAHMHLSRDRLKGQAANVVGGNLKGLRDDLLPQPFFTRNLRSIFPIAARRLRLPPPARKPDRPRESRRQVRQLHDQAFSLGRPERDDGRILQRRNADLLPIDDPFIVRFRVKLLPDCRRRRRARSKRHIKVNRDLSQAGRFRFRVVWAVYDPRRVPGIHDHRRL